MLLVSLLAHAPEPYELVVATDRPECYVWFGTRVEIEYLDVAGCDLARCRAVLDAAEARAAPRHVAASSGAIVLLDADVAGLACDSSRSSSGCTAARSLHAQAGVRAQPIAAARATAALGGAAFACAPVSAVTADDAMWNSGVLARPAADLPLVERALALYDALAAAGSATSRPSSSSKGSSSAAPAACAPPTRGSRTTGATSPATTPRSPAAWPTRSSKGCR